MFVLRKIMNKNNEKPRGCKFFVPEYYYVSCRELYMYIGLYHKYKYS